MCTTRLDNCIVCKYRFVYDDTVSIVQRIHYIMNENELMYFKISLLKHSCLVPVHEGVDGRYCFFSKPLFNYLF